MCSRPKCDSPGKHPLSRLVPNGLKDATTDEDTVRSWWRQFPSANVGLCTGGDFFVIDIDVHGDVDGRDSWRQLLEETLCIEIPKTAIVDTGSGGEHWFFSKDEYVEVRNKQSLRGPDGQKIPGIDVRGEGGYVVASPSIHASGGRYAWRGDGPHDLREAPAELLSLVAGVDEIPQLPMPASEAAADIQLEKKRPESFELGPKAKSAAPSAPIQHDLEPHVIAWIKEALEQIPPNEGREHWIEFVSMPLHEAFRGCEEGFQIWHEWCARGSGLRTSNGNDAYGGEEQCRRIWNSFTTRHRNPKGLSTFWGHARSHGWEPSPQNVGDLYKVAQLPDLPLGEPQISLSAMPVSQVAPWPEKPKPIWQAESEVSLDLQAAFPAELHWLRDLVLSIGELHHVPPAFPALISLGMAAGAAGRIFKVKLDETGWVEPMALWVMCGLQSGAGKSPVFRPLRRPFTEFERAHETSYDREVAKWDSQKKLLAGKITRAERELGKAGGEAEERIRMDNLSSLEAQMKDLQREAPQSRRITASSFSTPALVEFLMSHNERCLIIDTEGGIFGHVFGSARNMERDVDPWLQAFSSEPIQQDRVGDSKKGGIVRSVQNPVLSMAIATQVDAMDLFRDAYASSKGFLARFIPATFDYRLPESSIISGEIPASLQARWDERIKYLLGCSIPSEPKEILLGGVARAVFVEWMDRWLHSSRLDPQADQDSIIGYGSPVGAKVRSQAMRIIGLFHTLSDPATASERPVDPSLVRCVTEHWAPFILKSVQRVTVVLREDPDLRIAERLLRWIQRSECGSFTRHEAAKTLRAKNSGPAQVRLVDDLNRALSHLTDAGWIRPAEKAVTRGSGTVPAASRYLVHPDIAELSL